MLFERQSDGVFIILGICFDVHTVTNVGRILLTQLHFKLVKDWVGLAIRCYGYNMLKEVLTIVAFAVENRVRRE